MNEVSPGQDQLSEVDRLYRRLSAQDPGRPGEWVRRKVQAYAAQQAAERALRESAKAKESNSATPAPKADPIPAAEAEVAKRPWMLPVALGTIVAVAVVGFLVVSRLMTPHDEPTPPPPSTPVPSQTEAAAPRMAQESEPSASESASSEPSQSESSLAVSGSPESAPSATRSTESASSTPRPATSPSSEQSLPAPTAPVVASSSATTSRAQAPTKVGAGQSGAANPPSAPIVNSRAEHTTQGARSASPANPAPPSHSAPAPSASAQIASAPSAGSGASGASGSSAGSAGSALSAGSAASAGPAGPAGSAGPASSAPLAASAPSSPAAPPATAPSASQSAAAPTSTPPPVSTPTAVASNSPDALCEAAESGNMRDLKAALATNVDVNARDADGHTALILAIQHDHAAVVRELMVHGADPKIADSQGNTPSKAARIRGNSAILLALKNFANRSQSASATTSPSPATTAATQAAPTPVSTPPAPKPAPAAAASGSPDELCQAASSGDMRALKAALATNVDVNAPDADGHTALILAIQHDHAAAVRELLVHGASATTADSQGNTPQKAARLRGNSAILVALRNFANH